MPNLFRHPTGQAACLVYIMQNGLHYVSFACEVPKQVRHDGIF